MREHAVQVAVRLQHVLHHRHRPRPLTARGRPADDGDAGVLAHFLVEAARPILHRRDLGMVDDDDRSLVVEQSGERLRRQPPALGVVAGDVRHDLAAVCGDVDGEDRDAGRFGAGEMRGNRVRVAGRREDGVDVLGDEVLELRGLLRRVHLARHDDQIEVARRRFLPQRVLEILVEGVGLGEEGHAHQRPRPLRRGRPFRRSRPGTGQGRAAARSGPWHAQKS